MSPMYRVLPNGAKTLSTAANCGLALPRSIRAITCRLTPLNVSNFSRDIPFLAIASDISNIVATRKSDAAISSGVKIKIIYGLEYYFNTYYPAS
jgi:hypothetical protein